MTMKRLTRAAAVLSAAALITGVTATSASAGTSSISYPWSALGTPADIVGAHAEGMLRPTEIGGRFTVSASIKDTKADSHGARAYLRGSCGTNCTTEVFVSASGEGDVQSASWTLDTPITVQECLTEAGEDYECAEEYVIRD